MFYRSRKAIAASIPATANPLVPTLVERLGYDLRAIEPVGSRVTCSPAPTDTDEDWLILMRSVPVGSEAPKDIFAELGFRQDGNPEFYIGMENQFSSYRSGNLNVIVTADNSFFELFMTATALAKRFNLLHKADRIALFQAVLYQVDARSLELRPVSCGTDPIPDMFAA